MSMGNPKKQSTRTAKNKAREQCSDSLLEGCSSAAQLVTDVESFKMWIRQHVRPILPHQALACGYGRVHSAGVSMDYIVTIDYPIAHLAAISNAAGAIDTPLMRRWLATRKPVFFQDRIEGVIEDQWLKTFRKHALVNAAVDAVFDEQRCIGTYFSFHVLPSIDEEALTCLFACLTPLLHITLIRAITGTQQPATIVAMHLGVLSGREREIALWIGKGKSNAEIAQLIGLSENTVKHYLTRMLDKLGCANRAGLAAKIVEATSPLLVNGTKVL